MSDVANTRPRVVLTVPSLAREFGGPIDKARRLAGALRQLGHEVTLVGPGRDANGRAVALGQRGRFRSTPVPRHLGPLRAAISESEVVHVLGYRDPVGTLATFAARRRRVPYVLEPCGMHRRRIRSHALKAGFDATAGRLVISGASRIVATSRVEHDELVADGIVRERIVVRANGVDVDTTLDAAAGRALRERFGIPRDVPLVISIGRLTAKKGLTSLVRAVAGLPTPWLLIAGPDAGDGTIARLRALRDDLRATDRIVIVIDGLWGDDKTAALAAADVFCLPSVSENFGTAAAEAAVVGVPVVVSDQCGVGEWLDPSATRTVPHADVEALRTAVGEMISDPGVPAAARGAASAVRERLDWRSLAAQQADIYRELKAR
ncbi:MAG: glycosyltransferase [Acidimicrobiia bacterium]